MTTSTRARHRHHARVLSMIYVGDHVLYEHIADVGTGRVTGKRYSAAELACIYTIVDDATHHRLSLHSDEITKES